MKNPFAIDEKKLAPFTAVALEDEVDYEDILISGNDFSKIKTKSISFTKTIFRKVIFSESDMKRLRLYDCRFEQCDIVNANWANSAIQRTEFFQCRITGFNINGSQLKTISFKECKGEYTQFRQLQCKSISFKQCQLSFADFSESLMPEAVFTECDINNSDFLNTYLKDADIRSTNIDNIRIGIKELQGVIVDPSQALYLAGLLGIKIK